MNSTYLLTGGNMGDRLQNLQKAQLAIEEFVGIILKASSIYETAAWGLKEQSSFLNQVIHVSTTLAAEEVLRCILEIEQQLGRLRLQKMGPRTIDIDILFYNARIINLPHLTVPHPEIQNRRFVLTPLNEIAPHVIHPVLHKPIDELLHDCKDKLEVKKFAL